MLTLEDCEEIYYALLNKEALLIEGLETSPDKQLDREWIRHIALIMTKIGEDGRLLAAHFEPERTQTFHGNSTHP